MDFINYFKKAYLESKGIIFRFKEFDCDIAHDDKNSDFKLLYKELDSNENYVESIKEIKNRIGATYYWFYIKNKNVVYLYRRVGENRYVLLTEKLKGEAKKQRLNDLKDLSWENIDKLFDTKLVFNSFYNNLQIFRIELALEIKNFFINNKVENIDGKCISLAQRIIDRIIFTYFLGEKGGLYWVEGKSKLSAKEFFEILKEKNFYSELKTVFFDYFNKDYSLRSEEFYQFDKNTSFDLPYLNGGLFMPQKDIRNFREEDISITNDFDWFKLINLLNNYTWIIRDEIPEVLREDQEYEGNLTPDILGHLYEKFVITLELLGDEFTIENWDQAIQKNKGKDIKQIGNKKVGAYYTPEEITTYISQNTIKPFIFDKLKENKIKISETDLDKILENGDTTSKEVLELILYELSNVKICDPACGSGAFLLKAFELLHNYIVTITNKLKEIDNNYGLNYYKIAKNVISNSIYGVDIMEGAVEIAKLRLWLTLISYANNGKFEPLLNIDYKIRRGNSLIGFDDVSVLMSGKDKSLNNYFGGRERILKILNDVEKEKQLFLDKHGEEAVKLNIEIEKKLNPLREELNNEYFNEKLKVLNLSTEEKNHIKEDIFHWNLEFIEVFKPQQGGFDIIIGNPPYGENIKSLKEFYKKNYLCTEGKFEIYKYFIERGLHFLNSDGILSFITPDTWRNLNYFKKIRELVFEKYNLVSISETLYEIFIGVTIDTNIFFIKNQKKKNQVINLINNDFKEKKILFEFDENYVLFLKPKNDIIKFIENKFKKNIDDLCEVWQGLIAYSSKKEERKYTSLKQETKYHRKLLYGGNISKYKLEWGGEYLKYGKWLHRPRPEYIYDKKLLVQRIRNPKLKFRIISTLDLNGFINGTGLSNIVPKNKDVSLKMILTIINSNLINYWFSFYYFDVNIKPEQLRNIPIFDKISKPIIQVSNILLFIHQIENSKLINYFQNLSNNLVYELYFSNELKTNLIELSEKYLKDVNYDDWIKLYFKEEKTKEALELQDKLEKENIEMINNIYNEMSNSSEIEGEITKIQSHKWVKTIEKEIK